MTIPTQTIAFINGQFLIIVAIFIIGMKFYFLVFIDV